jgi:hypothetical protein
MSQYISKKEKKRVSKLITNKLLAMGVKDETTMTGSGRIRKFWRKDDKGNLITEKGKDGKAVPKLFDVEMPIAMNVLRRTVRELRNQPVEVINAFLSMPTSAE